MKLKYDIVGGDFDRAGDASSDVRRTLKKLNIDPRIIRRIVVALYEAEINVVAHAWKGKMEVDISGDEIRSYLKDDGPGIVDIDKAMEEGYTTASEKVREMGFGAGMGLPNIRRNTDDMNIKSVPGKGTEIRFVVLLK